MTAVFSAIWQTFRLGVQASPSGRTALSNLRATLSAPRQAKQPFHQFHSLRRISHPTRGVLSPAYDPSSAYSLRSRTSPLRHQLRWASLWKCGPEPEEKPEEEDGEQVNMTEDEVRNVFGKSIDPQEGVEVLMALQTRRLEGTLDQKMAYPDAWIDKGLTYLRAKFPLDEDAAIIARIDREMATGKIVHQSPSAVSQFEKLRRENKEKNEIERRKRETEEKQAIEKEGHVTESKLQTRDGKSTAPSRGLVGVRNEAEWVKKYRDEATDKEFPDITNIQRLVPSAVFVTVVLALCLLFAQKYKPPSRKARLWPDIPPAAATVFAIIGANFVVFAMWRIPQLWAFCNRTFIIAPILPHARTMLGAAFSHHQVFHLWVNMIGLWLVGTRVHDDIGRGPFLALYFASAVIGSFIPLTVYVTKSTFGTTTLGASGALCGLIAAACVLHEGQTIQLHFLPPEWTRGIDTGAVLALFILSEIRGLRKTGLKVPKSTPGTPLQPRVDHMGHLAGYAAGIGGAAIIRATDPNWRDAKREHWYIRDSKEKTQQLSSG